MNVEELAAMLNGSGALLGLDLGTKTIGLAVCDPGWQVVTPLHTLARSKFTKDAENLCAVAASRNIRALVLGLPLNMDGSEGIRAQSTRSFARNLAGFLPLPLLFWDERLTSVAAKEQMYEAGLPKKQHQAQIDARAAAIILQSAVDQLHVELTKTCTLAGGAAGE